MKEIDLTYDVAIVGGGMAGICAAIAAARQGAKTVLLQDRSVLGGNASSEIRMHICGATRHGKRPNLRETGIIEEILLENKYRNPEHSYGIFDTILWEKVYYQKNLDLFLNTYVNKIEKSNNKIVSALAYQMTTEKILTVYAKQFIDCTGDGLFSTLAGAQYMFGREGKDVFGEPNAVNESDTVTLGNTIQFRTLDAGRPVPFKRPEWAYDYRDSEWHKRNTWEEITSGYWWLEIGGTELNVIDDAEATRDELIKIVYGVWDYIKNYSYKKEEAKNYYLDWISFIPAKRESRRIIGDYILKEQDVLENRIFDDAIAYGGWLLDSHLPNAYYAKLKGEKLLTDKCVDFDGIYTIPYRSIYAKGIDNLYLAGRNISASHRAHTSTRVMATCSVIGQAAGVSAALAVKSKFTAAENIKNIKNIQQQLLKDGCYIPGVKNCDCNDKAMKAKIYADSFLSGYEPENVINGVSRPVDEKSNMWMPKQFETENAIYLSWDEPQEIEKAYITFDSNLTVEIMPSLSKWHHVRQAHGIPDTIVADFRIDCFIGDELTGSKMIRDNHQRLCIITLNQWCDKIKISLLKTNGAKNAGICEVRLY